MQKVAIISSLKRGGAERVSVYLSEYMVRHGIACDIISLSECADEYMVPSGVGRYVTGGRNPLLLRRALRKCGADVVVIMGVPLCLFAVPAVIGLKQRIVVSERNAPECFEGKKIVKHLSRLLMRFAHGFVFQTVQAKEYYDSALHGRGTVIPNPLLCDTLPEPYSGERDRVIVSVGRLETQKNQKILIEAFALVSARFPNYRLVIYGEGKLRKELQRQIEIAGLGNRIELPGNTLDVLEKIKRAALFVLPSRYEGIPNALIEAMALGLPCVSTDCPCGGASFLIENSVNGLLVPVDHLEALANAMEWLIMHPERAEQMGRQAIQIRERLDAEIIGKQWLDYLERV